MAVSASRSIGFEGGGNKDSGPSFTGGGSQAGILKHHEVTRPITTANMLTETKSSTFTGIANPVGIPSGLVVASQP